MGVRFRRRIRLAPGVHLNMSGSGISWSIGPRGASVTFGSRGTYLNTGIPGTGLHSRERIGPIQSRPGSGPPSSTSSTITSTVSIADDGTVVFLGQDGQPLSEHQVTLLKQQNRSKLQEFMAQVAKEINGHLEALEQIHLATPSPTTHPTYEIQPFKLEEPSQPCLRGYGFFGRFFNSTRERIDLENAAANERYRTEVEVWEQQKRKHHLHELERKQVVEEYVLTDVNVMETALETSLQGLIWPRETEMSAELRDDGRVVMLDVDLPEIEDIPRKTATAPQRGFKLSVKELSATRVQQMYMRHVHGVGFRVVGEVFYVLPKAEQVVLSAYSQRADKATGSIQDEYLYSVRVNRKDWERINFDNLGELDVTSALGQFDIRRDVAKSGLFKPITPFDGIQE